MITAFEPVTAASLGLPTPGAVTAAIPMFVVGILMWRRWLPRVAALFALVAGAALTSGWIYEGIRLALGWATSAIDWVTASTFGGVVPGALALVLVVYYALELRPDPATVAKLAHGGRAARPARRYGGTAVRDRYAATATRTRRRPDKLGAALVGLVLPSVAASIPGVLGASVTSALNLVGGSLAWVVGLAWGVA